MILGGRTIAEPTSRWIVVLTLVGYQLVASVGILAGAESRPLAITLRVVIFGLCAAAVFVVLTYRIKVRPQLLLAAFLLAYLGRLLFDQASGVPDVDDPLLFFVVAVLPPVVAVSMLAAEWRDGRAAWNVAVWGALTSAIILAMGAFHVAEWRNVTTGARLSFDVIDPISVGATGAITVIAALASMKTRKNFMPALMCALLGGIAVAAANSRGPMIALAGAGIFYVIIARKWRVGLLLVAALLFVAALSGFQGFLERFRFATAGYDGSSEIRLFVMRRAVEAFLDHPLVGAYFTDPATGIYPHNMFLEAAMAMGVIGLMAMVALMFTGLRVAAWAVNRGDRFLPLVFVFYFVNGQVSSAIHASPGLYVSLAILVAHSWVLRAKSSDQLLSLVTGPKPTTPASISLEDDLRSAQRAPLEASGAAPTDSSSRAFPERR